MARVILKNLNKIINKTLLTPADTLVRDLDNFIVESNKIPYTLSRSFKPSSSKCERNMWYQLHGTSPEERSTSSALVRIGENGTDSHVRVQNYLIKMSENASAVWEYYDVERYIKEHDLDLEVLGKNGVETKIYDKVNNIRFQTDGILYNRVTNLFYVFEFKTETSLKWDKREGVDPVHYN